MRSKPHALLATVLLVASLSVAPVTAQSLLGGVLGGESGDLVGIGSGPAGTDDTVNIGIGTGGGNNSNILDLRTGDDAARIRIRGGNGQGGLLNYGGLAGTGLLDGDDDGGLAGSGILGSNPLLVGIDLGGLGLDVNIGVGVGGGNPGGPGVPGTVGGRDGSLVASLGAFNLSCSVNDGRQVLQIAAQAQVNRAAIAGWARASNVNVVPIRLCPAARTQVAQILRASGKIQMLQSAAAADVLISASLSRTSYNASNVFAVERRGSQLQVYVY